MAKKRREKKFRCSVCNGIVLKSHVEAHAAAHLKARETEENYARRHIKVAVVVSGGLPSLGKRK